MPQQSASAIKTLIISDKFILWVHSEHTQSLASCKFDFGINALHSKVFCWERDGGKGKTPLFIRYGISQKYLLAIFKLFHCSQNVSLTLHKNSIIIHVFFYTHMHIYGTYIKICKEYTRNIQGMCNSMNTNSYLAPTWVLLTWVDPGLMLSPDLGSSWSVLNRGCDPNLATAPKFTWDHTCKDLLV